MKQILKTLSPTPPSSYAQLKSLFFVCSPLQSLMGTRSGSCGQFIIHCHWHSHLRTLDTLLTLHFTPSHKRQSSMNISNMLFPWRADLHNLLQCGHLPWGSVPQEQVAPVWDYKFWEQARFSMGFSPHRFTGPARRRSLLKVSEPPLDIHLLWCGVLHAFR